MSETVTIENTTSFYDRVVGSALDAFVCIERDGRISEWNPQAEATLGWARSECLQAAFSTLIIPRRFRDAYANKCREILSAGSAARLEIDVLHRDAYEFPAELTISPVIWNSQIYFATFIRDISKRKEIERSLTTKANELARSNADLEVFAYVASHDLQEPLRMVASYTQLLAKRYGGKLGQEADEFIGFAVDGATRMQQLIQDLLSYSRLDSNAKTPHFVLAETACNSAIDNLRDPIRVTNAKVEVHKLPAVLADPAQLTQLFQNLIGNAIKYRGARRPEIVIDAKISGSNWVFSVQDNGIGIEPDYFERIFQMFQRLHTRDEYPGTGIGLAICRKIVERHGGKIWVQSQYGSGSTFFFSIPRAERLKE